MFEYEFDYTDDGITAEDLADARQVVRDALADGRSLAVAENLGRALLGLPLIPVPVVGIEDDVWRQVFYTAMGRGEVARLADLWESETRRIINENSLRNATRERRDGQLT